MQKIKATFIGTDGSLGYKHGITYELTLLPKDQITICRPNGHGVCPYDSFATFLKNWKLQPTPRKYRACSVTYWKKNEGEKGGYTKTETVGSFHAWGVQANDNVTDTVAIVELEDGQIIFGLPETVVFFEPETI